MNKGESSSSSGCKVWGFIESLVITGRAVSFTSAVYDLRCLSHILFKRVDEVFCLTTEFALALHLRDVLSGSGQYGDDSQREGARDGERNHQFNKAEALLWFSMLMAKNCQESPYFP